MFALLPLPASVRVNRLRPDARVIDEEATSAPSRGEEKPEIMTTSDRPGGGADAYFRAAADSLRRDLLLAAACGDATLDQITNWFDIPQRRAGDAVRRGGLHTAARSLQAVVDTPPATRSAIYATARAMLAPRVGGPSDVLVHDVVHDVGWRVRDHSLLVCQLGWRRLMSLCSAAVGGRPGRR